MTISKTILAISAFTFLLIGPSQALETYCRAGGSIKLYDGANESATWSVTTTGARRVQVLGRQKPTRGCLFGFQATGKIIKNEFIQRPTLGRSRFPNKFSLYYETDRVGNDQVSYKITWEDWTSNKIASAIIRLNIQAIDHPY